MQFDKKAKSPIALIRLLRARGLVIESEDEALQVIKTIGYYRFSGYAYTFLDDKKGHRFVAGASFSHIINHYAFDRQLRFLLGEALHYIEVAVRTCISDTMSFMVSPHWFMDKAVFTPAYISTPYGYKKLLTLLDQKSGRLDRGKPDRMKHRDDFIRHYYDSYTDPEYPPSWMVAEVMTFGDWSIIYSNLVSLYKQAIANKLHLHKHDLQHWMHSLSSVRNICAHHSRVWNRNIAIQPSKKGKRYKGLFTGTPKLYNCIIVMLILLEEIGYSGDWKKRLVQLIEIYAINENLMGFPEEWQRTNLWQY